MRRVWVFGLIAVLAVSAIVAGSAGYLSGGEASGDVPESEIPEGVYTGPEDLNANGGNVSSLGWLCGGGSTDAYENYSPRSYEDYEYELANSSDGPTEERYVNVYEPGEPPKWIPESNVTVQELKNDPHATYEVTRYPNARPSERNIEEAWKLYNRSFETAKERGWFEFNQSLDDGFLEGSGAGLGTHYVNIDYMASNGSLNPHRPESLVYYPDPQNESNMILAGYMYHKQVGLDRGGRQVAGPLTVWHYHPMKWAGYHKFIRRYAESMDRYDTPKDMLSDLGLNYSSAEEFKNKNPRTAEMMHVWFVEHPEGPFATSMSVPSQVLKEPEKMSEEEFKEYVMASR